MLEGEEDAEVSIIDCWRPPTARLVGHHALLFTSDSSFRSIKWRIGSAVIAAIGQRISIRKISPRTTRQRWN